MYGSAPKDLGLIDLDPTEMMFWMYCPIKIAYDQTPYFPDNLRQFRRLVNAVYHDVKMNYRWEDEFDNTWRSSYVYITAKTLWVEGNYIGNRPGWHIDGFKTDDLNYIWYDRAPTEFLVGDFELSDDCELSMQQMYEYSLDADNDQFVTYPVKHLLRLDPTVIHRSPVCFEPGMRTFVKISVSKDAYDLKGNSINHELGDIFVNKVERSLERNHPASKHK